MLLHNDKTQLERFTASKERLIEKIRQLEIAEGSWQHKQQPAPQNALALYISLNPRCMKKATNFRKQNFNDKDWFQVVQKKYPVDQSGDQLLPVPGTFQGGFVPRFLGGDKY